MQHVAIMNKSWGLIPKIIDGQKKIESRWYFTKHKPWDAIFKGELVYFKDSGGLVSVKAEIEKVIQFHELTPIKVQEIFNKYGQDIGWDKDEIPKFLEKFQDKKYCILIFLKNPVQIKPFEIDKTGFGAMSAWITVSDVLKIKKLHKIKMKIIANNQEYNFSKDDLPLLIAGQDGVGASLFSIFVATQLFKSGHKIIFFTAYPAAKEEFKKILNESELEDCEFVNSANEIHGKRAIVINSGDEQDFIDTITSTPDLSDRVVFVKNLENYSEKILIKSDLLILSGNIDKCIFLEELKNINFKNKIFFSESNGYPEISLEKINKYEAIMVKGRENKQVILLNNN